jgi:prepilin-type N-terminal cleavage/methylation domain-containing protein
MEMAIRRDRGLPCAARGFTIVELLVSVAIIGTLSGLLLPAVQSARESARLTACKNHVSQIAKAMIRHETAMGHFPSGGWSPSWLGVAERPSDSSQPGGWTFGILPYAEELATRDLVADATALTAPSVYRQLATTPVKLFTCPSRRTSAPIAVVGSGPFSTAAATGLTLTQATRSDYAANGGSVGNCPPLSVLRKVTGPVANGTRITISHAPPGNPNNCQSLSLPYNAVVNAHLTPNHPSDRLGPCSGCSGSLDATIYTPTSLADGDAWRKATLGQKLALSDMGIPDLQDGFVHRMSRVTSAHILDGLTMTYLVGEKFMAADRYRTGTDAGDGGILFAGYSSSNTRFGLEAPRQDERNASAPTAFGGPHRAGFTIAFGDGSVRTLPYEIDPAVHKSLSARADGAVVTIP